MRSEVLLWKIYREHPAPLRWVYVPVCSPCKSQQAAWPHGRGDTPGTMRSRGWNVQFGWWEDGGPVFKSTRAGKKMKMKRAWASQWTKGKPQRKQLQDLPTGIHALMGSQEHQPTIPSQRSEDKKGAFLQNRASFLFQVYFLNKCHFQLSRSLAHFVTGGCSNQRENLSIWQM